MEAQGKRILIVEDDASTRKLLEVLLRRNGDLPTSVDGGTPAMELLDRESFDLVILDLMMPHVSGISVIEHIARRHPRTPVIVCTAAGPKATESLPRETVRQVFRKPFDITELSKAIEDETVRVQEPPVTVLIVDDDERARYIMRTLVSPIPTIEAADAETALRAVQEQRPDAVLLDLTLPGMPGEELLRKLKDDPATAAIPVILVTSRKVTSIEEVPALQRADAYIYKGDLSRDTVRTAMQIVLKVPRGAEAEA